MHIGSVYRYHFAAGTAIFSLILLEMIAGVGCWRVIRSDVFELEVYVASPDLRQPI
jgi:hypothetical protein